MTREPNYGTNDYVAKMWVQGKSAKTHNGNMSTDGDNLYSYRMLIGRTVNDVKQVLNVRGLDAVSVTTSAHVSDAAYACHKYAPLNGYVLVTPVHQYTGSMSSCRRFPYTGEQYNRVIGSRKTERGIKALYERMGYSEPFQKIMDMGDEFIINEEFVGA